MSHSETGSPREVILTEDTINKIKALIPGYQISPSHSPQKAHRREKKSSAQQVLLNDGHSSVLLNHPGAVMISKDEDDEGMNIAFKNCNGDVVNNFGKHLKPACDNRCLETEKPSTRDLDEAYDAGYQRGKSSGYESPYNIQSGSPIMYQQPMVSPQFIPASSPYPPRSSASPTYQSVDSYFQTALSPALPFSYDRYSGFTPSKSHGRKHHARGKSNFSDRIRKRRRANINCCASNSPSACSDESNCPQAGCVPTSPHPEIALNASSKADLSIGTWFMLIIYLSLTLFVVTYISFFNQGLSDLIHAIGDI